MYLMIQFYSGNNQIFPKQQSNIDKRNGTGGLFGQAGSLHTIKKGVQICTVLF